MESILNVKNLNISFDMGEGTARAIRGISFSMEAGEILALVGESGCGKSVTAQSVLRLLSSPPACVTADVFEICGVDILSATDVQMESVRRQYAGMVFQDPLSALNPTMRVGAQITESLLRTKGWSKRACAEEAVRLLRLVQIPQPEYRARQYPHQYSGGMRQRAMIAMALAADPKLLLADEPVTALDVTVQLQILKLLKQIQSEFGTAVLFITHDLSVVANLADRVAVMYAGKLVEMSGTAQIFDRPFHPYTRALLESLPAYGEQKTLKSVPGSPPDLLSMPRGCAFAPRCEGCMRICLEEDPPSFDIGDGRWAACWKYHPDCR